MSRPLNPGSSLAHGLLSLSEEFEAPFFALTRRRSHDALKALSALEPLVQASLLAQATAVAQTLEQTIAGVTTTAPGPISGSPNVQIQMGAPLPPAPAPPTYAAPAPSLPPRRGTSPGTIPHSSARPEYRRALADPTLVEALLQYQKGKPRGVLKAPAHSPDDKPHFQFAPPPTVEASPKAGLDPRRPSSAFQTILHRPPSAPPKK